MKSIRLFIAIILSSIFTTVAMAASKSDIPNASGMNTDNVKVDLLSFLTGKNYVLVDFWASWCPPCKASMPKLVETYTTYKGKGLEIVGICVRDQRPAYLKAVADHSITWPSFLDETSASKTFNLKGVPTFILYAPNQEELYNGHDVNEAVAIFEQKIKSKK